MEAGAAYAYDSNSNLTADGSSVYLYDVENRLVQKRAQTSTACPTATTGYTGALQANVAYDPLGRLFQVDKGTAGTTTVFLYDGDALVAEYNSTGATLLARYVHGSNAAADDPLVWYTYTSGIQTGKRFLHADHLGSIVAMTNGNSAPSIDRYDEYGIPGTTSTGTVTNVGRFQYTGQAYIPELGMYDYKARIYSPRLGRFLQTDPVGYDGGINIYEYADDDPVNEDDPAGTGPSDWGLGFVVDKFMEDPIGRTADAIDAVTNAAIAVETIASAGTSAAGPDEVELGGERAATSGLRALERSEIRAADRAPSRATGPYQRPSGATTRAQRESVQGRPCAICGKTTERQVAGHKEPLVKEHHETGAIDKQRMRSLDAVRPECPTCSAKEGAELSRYSKQMNEQFPK